MELTKNCEHCGVVFTFPHWRISTAKFCSKECSSESKIAKANITCTFCGKLFHMKKSQQNKYKRSRGFYCSYNCQYTHLAELTKGDLNHQFGLKGELNSSFKGKIISRANNNLTEKLIYVPNHHFKNKDGRVLLHRYLVEQNYNLFSISFFIEIDGRFYLNPKYDVHHKDGNHNNNSIDNLEILTRGEHSRLHNIANPMKKDLKTGRFISR